MSFPILDMHNRIHTFGQKKQLNFKLMHQTIQQHSFIVYDLYHDNYTFIIYDLGNNNFITYQHKIINHIYIKSRQYILS